MRRTVTLAIGMLVCALSSGCLCRHATDCYGNLIDEIGDHSIELDCLYQPSLDVSRIGKPDWCRCPLNAALDCQKCTANGPYYGPRNRTFSSCNCSQCSGLSEESGELDTDLYQLDDENRNPIYQ